jgi:predicted permease
MGTLLQDLRYALRTFRKAPGFTAVAVIVLALGVGANSAIFTLVNALVFKPLSGHADELVGIYNFDRTVPDSYRAFSYPNYADIRDQAGVFDGLMAHMMGMVGVPAGDTTRRTFVSVVSSNYFDTLGVSLAAGRPFTAAEERPGARVPVAVVNYARWKQAGLDPAFLGRTIRINAEDFTVIGVAPEGFTGTMALVATEMWLPLGMYDVVVNDRLKNKGTGLDDRSNHGLVVAGRLKRGLTDQVVQARLDALARQLADAYPAENPHLALSFNPLPRMATSTRPMGDGPLAALTALFLALSGGVLLVACLNIANMLLARGTARRKEIAVRLALGASRRQVVRQMLTEAMLLSAVGAAVGLILSYASTRALAASLLSVLPLALEFDPRPDSRVLAATLGFAVASTIVFGLGPALKLSRRDLVADLKDLGQDTGAIGRRFGARNVLVAVQVALSLTLLVAGGLFARAALVASRSTPGFEYDRIALASIDPSLAGADERRGRQVHRDVLERLRSVPGVEAVGAASTVPFGDFHEGERVERVGEARAGEPPSATYRITSADYFRSLGLRMLRGREFTFEEERSPDPARVAIIDMALAQKLFGDEDPLGQQIRVVSRERLGGSVEADALQIVGIAPPIRDEVVDPGPTEHLYVPAGRHYRGEMHLTIRTARPGSETALLPVLRRELRSVDPELPVLDLKTMRAFHQSSLGLWALRAGGYMFTLLGALALLLAVVGIYGLRSYVVAQRTREFGIRMALGADAASVRSLVLREGLGVCLTGLLLGLPLAILVAQAMMGVLHRIGGTDPVVFTVAPAILATAALVASYIPARRATAIAPIDALRDL